MEEIREPEVWKDIPGYEGLYQVSSWGKVKSFDMLINHYSGIKRIREGKILRSSVYPKTQHLTVVLCKDRIKKRIKIHILVMTVFNGRKKNNTDVCNHKDLDRFNNYYKNLEWVSVRENTSHYYNSKEKTSKYIGVAYRKGYNRVKPWKAAIYYNKKNIYLGSFKTEEEAHQAYLDALEKYNLENKYAEKNTL